MANRAKSANKANHARQEFYKEHGIIMLPTLDEELAIRKQIAAMRKSHGKEVSANG